MTEWWVVCGSYFAIFDAESETEAREKALREFRGIRINDWRKRAKWLSPNANVQIARFEELMAKMLVRQVTDIDRERIASYVKAGRRPEAVKPLVDLTPGPNQMALV